MDNKNGLNIEGLNAGHMEDFFVPQLNTMNCPYSVRLLFSGPGCHLRLLIGGLGLGGYHGDVPVLLCSTVRPVSRNPSPLTLCLHLVSAASAKSTLTLLKLLLVSLYFM